MAEQVTFSSRSGVETTGVIALPAGGDKAPAVVLIQEWWGINAHIKSLVDRFAAAGFVTIAPDLYRGTVATDAAQAGKLMQELDGARAMDDIAGAVRFALAHPRGNGKVGVAGFCMGGAYSFAAATQLAGLGAVVPFYGIPAAANADYTKVTAPIMAHFASRDDWAVPSAAEAIKKQLDARGQAMTLHIYEADHAFMNDTRPEVYNADAAKLAWDRTVTFLHTHLDGRA